MKKRMALFLSTIMTVSLAGCSNSKSDVANTSDGMATTSVESKDVSGDVTIAVYPSEQELYEYIFNSTYFKNQYPNIKVTVEPWAESGSAEWLTTQAANNTLPDVMLDWQDVTYPVSQGWVYPLTEYLKNDSDAKYIPERLAGKYIYGGENYAVPYRFSLRTFAINTDMLDSLNLDAPEYDWSIDDFKALLMQATSTSTSGMNYIGWMEDAFLASMSSQGYGAWGYDKNENRVNLTDGNFVLASNLIKELESVPGLCSDELIDDTLTAMGEQDDYAKKFGDGVDAVADGKVLVTNTSTWDYSWYKNYTFNYDFYPIPGAPGSSPNIIIYTDHAFMTSTTKCPDASYEVLKFVTFGSGGYAALIDYEREQQTQGNEPNLWLPMSDNPDQLTVFDGVEYAPAGIKWAFNNLDDAVAGDYNKCVPGMTTCITDYLNPAIDEIHTGTSDADAIVVEVEEMANNYLRESAESFNRQVAAVQEEFSKTH